jgi:hypothetical protein
MNKTFEEVVQLVKEIQQLIKINPPKQSADHLKRIPVVPGIMFIQAFRCTPIPELKSRIPLLNSLVLFLNAKERIGRFELKVKR